MYSYFLIIYKPPTQLQGRLKQLQQHAHSVATTASWRCHDTMCRASQQQRLEDVRRRKRQKVIRPYKNTPPRNPLPNPPPHLQTCPKEANKAKTQQNNQAPCSDPGNY